METVMNGTELRFCEELIRRVGKELLRHFHTFDPCATTAEMTERFQHVNDAAQDQLRKALAQRFPEYAWSDAEFDVSMQKQPEFEQPYWVADPVDGAVHFLNGVTMWASTLCLVKNGKAVASFIYDPCRDELFTACAGQGAWRNGERIHASKKTDLSQSIAGTLFASSFPMKAEIGRQTAESVSRVMPEVFATRVLGAGSLQLAYVACGRLDGYWEYGTGLYDWLAGSLLVQEAGGRVTAASGEEFGWSSAGILASGTSLHPQLLQLIAA